MIGYCTSPQHSGKLKRAGFDYVEIQCGDLEILHGQDMQVPIVAVNNLFPQTLSLFGDRHGLEKAIKHVEHTFQIAQNANIQTITFGSGRCRRIASDVPSMQELDIWGKLLKFIDSLVVTTGINVGLESLTRKETNFLNSIESVARSLELNECEHIGLTVDSYHFFENSDSYDSIREFGQRIAHIHIAGEGRTSPKKLPINVRKFLDVIVQCSAIRELAIETNWNADFEPHSSIVKELRTLGF